MSVSSRKTTNQSYKRESFPYPSHQPSSGTIQDGMTSLTGTNSIPLATGGTASVPSAANSISPHSASYLSTGPTLTASGTHIPAAYHLPHGSASSSQPTLALSSHSQGPTPASTPPTVPNETKGPGQYQNYTHTMNQHPLTYGRLPSQTGVIINNNASRAHNQPRLQQIPRHHYLSVNTLNPGGHPLNYSIGMLPSAVLPNNSASATNIIPTPNYQLPGTGGSEHNLVFMPTPQYSTYYNNPAVRGAWPSATNARAATQNVVQVGQASTIIPSTPPYLNINSVPSIPQQQPIQQHTPAVSSAKSRSKALKIIDPNTGKEINLNDGESAKPDKKDSPNDVKRPSESLPSSGYSSSSSSMTYTNKEQSQSVLNGTAPNVPFGQSTNDWKGSSHSGVASGFSQVDICGNSVVKSLKPANVPTSIQSAKMDYKKPTREEQPSGDVQPDDSKLRDKQTSSSWPETPGVQPTIVTPAQSTSQRGVPPGTKKPPKEAETTVSNSSSVSSTPVSSVPPTILTTTVPSDGVNKSIVTTSTIGIEDPENGSKKTTKQGIQGGIAGVPKDGIPSTKPTIGKPPLAAATSSSPAAVVSSNQSLPEAIQTTTLTGVSSSAQNSVTKMDSKSQSSVPLPATAGVIPGTKPPATALSTSGPNSEKSSPISSSSTPSPDTLSASKSTSVANASLEKGAPAFPAKDEKSSPSAKPKRSGKDQSSEGSAHEHSNANAKGKTAQTVPPKQHGNDVAKPSASAPLSSVPAKQTNGETVEANNAPEGKSKKKKSSSKKELNKKGQEKEGSDMDMFTKIEQTPTLPEKGVRAERVPQPNPQPLAVNTNSNNRSKINSSQKSENISSVNSLDTKEKVISSQNIPVVAMVPAQPADTNKTENIEPVEDTKTERKKYSVKFMLGMRSLPQCQLAVNVQYLPVTLPPLGGSGSRGMSQNGYSGGGGGNFLPNFMAQSGPSLAPRKSQQNSMRRDKPNQIHVSLSLREEVPLRRSKDAWKPAIFSNDPKSGSDEDKKTEVLFKAARGILNKLTPEKFPVLIEKFKLLPIDSLDRLRGVIDLIFEKAIDEPGFCKWYAEMCNIMQNTVVDDVDPNGKAQTFRTVLLNKCQNQFESAKADEADADKKRAEFNSCTDPEKKKELQLVYEEKERKARRKSVGNCRFIGELFKLKMLTPKIVVTCIRLLISQLEEESLECLCKLLTTIGKEIDEKLPKETDSFFKRMQEIADQRKTPKISSRIRFMILDVIDLRKNKWVPRRETDNPKTIDQMNFEMEKKEQEQKIANMTNMTMRKSHDDYRPGNKDSRKNRYDNPSNDNSWTTVTNKNSNTSKLNYKVDGSKFANIASGADQQGNISLGTPHNFSMWRGGSTIKQDKKSVLSTPMNDRMDATRSSSVSSLRHSTSGKLTPSSSLERPKQNLPLRDSAEDANKMSRSSSAQSIHPASRESSVPRGPPSRNASQTAPVPTPSISPVPTPTVTPLPNEQAKQFSETIFNEYVNNHSLKDTILDVSERLKADEDKRIAVEVFIDRLLEKPDLTNDCAKIVTALIEAKVLPVPVAVEAVSNILQIADDLKYDYPKFWEYIGNFLSGWPLLYENCQVFNELKTVLQQLPNSEDCSAVLSQLEKTIRNNKGRILEFLSQALDTEEYDNVFKWINENVDSPNCNPNLVVALTEAVCEAVLKEKLKAEDIKEKYGRYFKKYIDNEETLELKCLNTIVDFSQRKEHPKGLLLEMFEGLYDSKALSSDSFMQLKNGQNKEELGVALTIVKTFYAYLEEPDEET